MYALLSILGALGSCVVAGAPDVGVAANSPIIVAGAPDPADAPRDPAAAPDDGATKATPVDPDDDGPPYGNGPGKGRRNGRGGNSACTGYVDADGDGVCDNCNRTARGCPRSPSATPGVDAYSGMPTVQDYVDKTTLENMQAAYNGESNARERYLEFALKADEEGYAGVAALFRAAARAEGIHAENHAEVIRQLGAVATATIEDVIVATTRENLETAINGESYEWDVMYPGMVSRARADRDRQAIRSLNFAMTAERDHARLYRAALADLDSWKTARPFFVCTVCGETVERIDFTKCPSCFARAEAYVRVD